MILTIVAAIILSVALTVQKQEIGPNTTFGKLIKNKLWVMSIFITLIGFILYLHELLNEKIVIVQPLIATTIIWTVLFETVFLKKKINKTELIIYILAFVGIVLIGVSV